MQPSVATRAGKQICFYQTDKPFSKKYFQVALKTKYLKLSDRNKVYYLQKLSNR